MMKCIMRMISSSPVAQYAEGVLGQLADILKAVCKNPTQPGFNHYLFEAVAALIKQTCAANPARLDVFEKKLFPVFDIVLQDGESGEGFWGCSLPGICTRPFGLRQGFPSRSPSWSSPLVLRHQTCSDLSLLSISF